MGAIVVRDAPRGPDPTSHGLTLTPDEQALAWRTCEGVMAGHTLARIEREGGPSPALFLAWVQTNPLLARAFQAARELSAYMLEDQALEASVQAQVKPPKDATGARALALFLEQHRWSAMRRAPAVFGDRATVQITVPVQINTSLDLGPSSTTSTAEFPNIYELKSEIVHEVGPADVPESLIARVEAGDDGAAAVPQGEEAPFAWAEAFARGKEPTVGPDRPAPEPGQGKGEGSAGVFALARTKPRVVPAPDPPAHAGLAGEGEGEA